MNEKYQALLDYHLEHGYHSFTRHFRSVKRENMRPVTHLQNQAPITQKSMTVGDMADSDVEDFPGPMDDKFKIWQIDPASCDIRGNADPRPSIAHGLQCMGSFALRKLPGQGYN